MKLEILRATFFILSRRQQRMNKNYTQFKK